MERRRPCSAWQFCYASQLAWGCPPRSRTTWIRRSCCWMAPMATIAPLLLRFIPRTGFWRSHSRGRDQVPLGFHRTLSVSRDRLRRGAFGRHGGFPKPLPLRLDLLCPLEDASAQYGWKRYSTDSPAIFYHHVPSSSSGRWRFRIRLSPSIRPDERIGGDGSSAIVLGFRGDKRDPVSFKGIVSPAFVVTILLRHELFRV